MGSGPVFVLGILPRSGTNHVAGLLRLHADLAAPAGVPEDLLLRAAHHLVRYVDATVEEFRSLHAEWGVHELLARELGPSLGHALLRPLQARIPERTRVLTKSPSVRNIALFHRLFPDGRLVVVVRDGRDVVESSVRSFGGEPELYMRRWARAARELIGFEREATDAARAQCLVLHYEDVVSDLTAPLTSALRHVDADPAAYDFEAAARAPVRGSSEAGSTARSGWAWRVEEAGAAFSPVSRWHGWSTSQHRRFNWIAGEELRSLGYDPVPTRPSSLANRAADARWRLSQAPTVRRFSARRKRAGEPPPSPSR